MPPESTLEAWRIGLRSMDRSCPWPGAAPLDTNDGEGGKDLLVGRKNETRDFTRLVFNTDVVVLTGQTGVGKSSLLKAGLLPSLERRHFEVILCNFSRLTNLKDDRSASQVIAQLAERMPEGIERDGNFVETLDLLYPNTAVILLDQFEELIRYQPKLYGEILEWIHETASTTRIRIVISLRIEFEHQLYGHGGLKLGPFQQARMELLPIFDPADIGQVIRNKQTTDASINDEAFEALIRAWELSGAVQGRGDVRLLNLHALLYVLWVVAEGETITINHIGEVAGPGSTDLLAALAAPPRADEDSDWEVGSTASLFENGLAEYVRHKLTRARAACSSSGVAIDRVLTARTADLVVAVSRHLSSGGYKVPQALDDLAELVLFDGTTVEVFRTALAAEPGRKGLSELSRRFAGITLGVPARTDNSASDWLSVRRSDLLGESGPPVGKPWDLDPKSVTSGALMGLRPEDAALEDYRAFYFALEWLRECSLVSVVSTGDKTMVQLVHDGFDEGLRRWRESLNEEISSAILRGTATHGARFTWRTLLGHQPANGRPVYAPEPPPELDGKLLSNLRWTSCQVTASFRSVAFVNCDFSGTTFSDCRFEGVTFVNCLMDGVEFRDFDVVGVPYAPPSGLSFNQLTQQPAFVVGEAPDDVIRSLVWYRELPDSTNRQNLFSETAGFAAVPADPGAESHPRFVPFHDAAPFSPFQSGGLVMAGGRLSSLKIRRCTFVGHDAKGAGARLALRYVAGASVEIAEQTHANLDVFAAALRGLTVTLPVDDCKDEGVFNLRFEEAQVINTWFGVRLVGEAVFDSCQVWQLFNASDTFVVQSFDPAKDEKQEDSGSKVYGAINIATPEEPPGPEDPKPNPPTRTSLGELETKVADSSRKIDYRQHPED